MALKVIIFGTGRSGTTALYTLLQEIMLSTCGRDVDFVYESFLRDKDTFNGRYGDVKEKSRLIDSLSFEGIFNHLRLPLFIEEPGPYLDNTYLRQILQPETPEKHVLAKFIRANGRYLLLERICPDFKFIFIIRNPVDVVNSIIRRFSFYGGEFHKDDYPRFISQVNRLYRRQYTGSSPGTVEEKELLYWYYMNRFALETIEKAGKKVLILCYEAYVSDRENQIKKICDHVEIDFRQEYIEAARQPVGSITRQFEIPRSVFETYRDYLEEYIRLLSRFHIDAFVNEDEIFSKYRVVDKPPTYSRPYYGLHGRAILRECQKLLKEKDRKLKRQ